MSVEKEDGSCICASAVEVEARATTDATAEDCRKRRREKNEFCELMRYEDEMGDAVVSRRCGEGYQISATRYQKATAREGVGAHLKKQGMDDLAIVRTWSAAVLRPYKSEPKKVAQGYPYVPESPCVTPACGARGSRMKRNARLERRGIDVLERQSPPFANGEKSGAPFRGSPRSPGQAG